jgi:hypothetical protein
MLVRFALKKEEARFLVRASAVEQHIDPGKGSDFNSFYDKLFERFKQDLVWNKERLAADEPKRIGFQ